MSQKYKRISKLLVKLLFKSKYAKRYGRRGGRSTNTVNYTKRFAGLNRNQYIKHCLCVSIVEIIMQTDYYCEMSKDYFCVSLSLEASVFLL